MTLYQFQFEDFALSEDGIHLLRNRFNFKTIKYADVKLASVKNTTEIKNAPIVMILGIAMVCFAFYQTRWVIGLFNDPKVYHIYIESIVLPIIPAVLGVYCIYIAARKGPVLLLDEGAKKHKLRLRAVIKNNLVDDFEKYLAGQLGARFVVINGLI
jgi:hypothetical protein